MNDEFDYKNAVMNWQHAIKVLHEAQINEEHFRNILLNCPHFEDCKEIGHMYTWFPKEKKLCLRCGKIE